MRKLRTCVGALLNTGISKCPIDFGKIRGVLLVPKGKKLPALLTAESLKKACHADRSERVYPIGPFVEFAKNGGEPQANANGYGGVQVTDLSARTDTFTMDKFYPEVNASLLKVMNQKYDAYYYDDKNYIYGVADGEELAGIPMSTVYPTDTSYPTSSASASLTVSLAYEDARSAMEKLDYIKADFDIRKAAVGLVEVEFGRVGNAGNAYKLYEKVGGYDVTAIYGELLADNAVVIAGTSAATYSAADETLTLTVTEGAEPKLKAPKTLLEAGIEGIEQA